MSTTSWIRRAATALLTGVCASSALSPVTAAAPPSAARALSTEVVAPVPTIDWGGCGRSDLRGLRCARVQVPLDYDDVDGATTTLALAKLPARDPSRRIGSLFVNPGGPGGSARQFVLAAQLLGHGARNRFDVIGIDPRGIGASTPVTCRIDATAPPAFAFPFTAAQVTRRLSFDTAVRQGCDSTGNAILDHMSTADTARDMDLIRQAVGDKQLTYYGISYGSYLGATYAAMFPDRVRALIVDGVLDPVAWSTGRRSEAATLPFSTRIGSGLGAAETMASALDECNRVGSRRCPMAPHARAKWNRIVDRLRQGPARVQGGRLRFPDLFGSVTSALYEPSVYPQLMTELAGLHRAMFPRNRARVAGDPVTALQELAEQVRGEQPAGPWSRAQRATYSPGFEGVACSDTANPRDPDAWAPAAAYDDRRGGSGFGRLWTWASSTCAGWPGSSADSFRGPWQLDTSTPVLIVGNSHDPATSITGAVALHKLFGNSRLVTLDTWGHGALGQSDCVTRLFGEYLTTRALPASDVACRPDTQLFPRSR